MRSRLKALALLALVMVMAIPASAGSRPRGDRGGYVTPASQRNVNAWGLANMLATGVSGFITDHRAANRDEQIRRELAELRLAQAQAPPPRYYGQERPQYNDRPYREREEYRGDGRDHFGEGINNLRGMADDMLYGRNSGREYRHRGQEVRAVSIINATGCGVEVNGQSVEVGQEVTVDDPDRIDVVIDDNNDCEVGIRKLDAGNFALICR